MLSGSYTEPAEEQDDEGGLQNVPTRIASRQTKASRSQEQVKSKCFSSITSKPINIRWIRIGSISHTEKLCFVSYFIRFSTNINVQI